MMDYDEATRLRALRSYDVLDTPPEPNFDRMTQLAASIFEKPVCTLSLADAHRHWFKSRFGVDATEMPRKMSFCDETIGREEVFVVNDAQADPRFRDAAIVAGTPHLRFYAGAPLVTPSGMRIGSLCVLDTKPVDVFSQREAFILLNLANTAVELLEARSRQIELGERTKAIAHLARHDSLTGLPNRRHFVELIENQISHHASIAALFMDLDGFKQVNDRHGHHVGDKLLRVVADRIRSLTWHDHTIARLGGDEFVIALRGDGDIALRAADLASRALKRLSAPFLIEGVTITVGASIGIAVRDKATKLEELLKAADLALYEAKNAGRANIKFSDRCEIAGDLEQNVA